MLISIVSGIAGAFLLCAVVYIIGWWLDPDDRQEAFYSRNREIAGVKQTNDESGR